MIQSPIKTQHKQSKPAGGVENSTVWVETEEKTSSTQEEANGEMEEYLKREHQAYLAQKLKRKEELEKIKLQQFGDSSSDSDGEINIEKNRTNDSSNELPVLKTVEYYSGKASSKADSEHSVQLKKVQSVHVGPGKVVENLETLEVLINSKKGVDIWIDEVLKFKEKTVQINGTECSYYEINKIKIIFANVVEDSFRVKISWGSEETLFAASRSKCHFELPKALYVFAKVITEKLEIMNRGKANSGKGQQFPESLMKSSYIYGRILKKSRLINRWTEVFAAINKDGLWYRKKYNDKQKLLVKRTQITELWTRFEFEEGFMVLKMFENSSKIELAIPISNFLFREGWLYHIYDLIFKRQ